MAGKHWFMTAEDKRIVWRGWHAGRSMSDLGREIGKAPASVFGLLRQHGGIEPARRVRRPDALVEEEREEISRRLSAGESLRGIARALGRSPSTISREVARNGGHRRYRSVAAERAAWERAERPKPCRLATNATLLALVEQGLEARWSPQQISGWLARDHADEDELQVSHETIYKSLYIQSRGVLKNELKKHLRTRRRFRQSRSNNRRNTRGQIRDLVSISERPAEVEDRAVPGHWEGDLIKGRENTYIATLVERYSRFVMLVKVPGASTQSVVDALAMKMNRLPEELQKTLTWDRGVELSAHARFSVATNIAVYFCDPSSPWQRGSNENTNGLLRQYFPKGTNLGVHEQSYLDEVAGELNNRPRKTLDYTTPARRLNEALR